VAVLAFAESNWDKDALASRAAVLAGFWAEWCLPSHALEGTLEAAAARYDARLRVGLVDVDREPELAERCGIQGLPTLVLVQSGREVLRRVGLLSVPELLKLLDATLAPG